MSRSPRRLLTSASLHRGCAQAGPRRDNLRLSAIAGPPLWLGCANTTSEIIAGSNCRSRWSLVGIGVRPKAAHQPPDRAAGI